jgi:acetoin utilization protein AcuB
MKIESLMVSRPITITVRANIHKALDLMKSNSIRHLPVVDSKNQLKGLLTLADLKQALLPSMLSDLSLADLMIKHPITVSPDDDLEYAARLIYRHKIGGLPVVRKSTLVGIITETDILRAFIDMLGIIGNSARLDITTGKNTELNKAIQIIHDHGADIINIGMTAQQAGNRTYHFRLSVCELTPIKQALEKERFIVDNLA